MRTIVSSWNKIEVSKEYSDAVYELWADRSASVTEESEALQLITYTAPDDSGTQRWAVVIDDPSNTEIEEFDDEPSARGGYERHLRERRD